MSQLDPPNPNDIMDVEDFERANPWTPPAKAKQVDATDPIDSERMAEFNRFCQEHGFQPEWEVEEVAPQVFAGKVQVAGREFVSEKEMPSKKHVKDELCRQALETLSVLMMQKSKDDEAKKARLNSEEWVSILNGYTQKARLPPPAYTTHEENGSPCQFSTTVHIPAAREEAFGLPGEHFPKKAEAKKAAAREAVIWLRSAGKLESETSQAGKKQKPTAEGSAPSSSGPGSEVVGLSEAEKVRNLCKQLGLSQCLMWQLEEEENFEPLVKMSAIFAPEDVVKEPRLEGEVGTVRYVYGKKKAKEQCSAKVIAILEDIIAQKADKAGKNLQSDSQAS